MLLKVGSKGDDVKKLQEKLGTSVDGDFGPGTEKKVKEWQKSNGLVDDGIIGQLSWDKLKLGTMIKEDDIYYNNTETIQELYDKNISNSISSIFPPNPYFCLAINDSLMIAFEKVL